MQAPCTLSPPAFLSVARVASPSRNRQEPHCTSFPRRMLHPLGSYVSPWDRRICWKGSKGPIPVLKLPPLRCVTLRRSPQVLVSSSIECGSAGDWQHFASVAGRSMQCPGLKALRSLRKRGSCLSQHCGPRSFSLLFFFSSGPRSAY